MSVQRDVEARLLTEQERADVEATHYPRILELSRQELAAVTRRLREQRDRAQAIGRQQRREMRGKADARGSSPARDNLGTVQKAQVLAQAVKRANSELARHDAPEPASPTQAELTRMAFEQRQATRAAHHPAPAAQPTPACARTPAAGGRSGWTPARSAAYRRPPRWRRLSGTAKSVQPRILSIWLSDRRHRLRSAVQQPALPWLFVGGDPAGRGPAARHVSDRSGGAERGPRGDGLWYGAAMSVAYAQPPTRMTVAEFLQWDSGDRSGRRWQLRDGEPEAMAPGSLTHGAIQSELGRLLGNYLIAAGRPERVLTAPGIIPRVHANTNFRIPDLGVTCAQPSAGSVMAEPVVLIEILSPNNEAETLANVWAFATIPSVREILLVRTAQIGAELLRRTPDSAWPETPEMLGTGDTLILPSVGFTVPLAALYRTTTLAAPHGERLTRAGQNQAALSTTLRSVPPLTMARALSRKIA